MKLGRYQATALALSFVVGSGILVLPVLSLQTAGAVGSLYAWILMTLIGIPLVLVFHHISLTQDFTLTQCFTRSFGPGSTLGAKLTVLGALVFGMPAMVYTASGVIARLVGLPESYTSGIAHLLLTLLCLNHLRPLKQSAKISFYSATFLMLLIATAVGTHLQELKTGAALLTHAPSFDSNFLQACTLTFFGYVGWESLGFFSNELEHPKRDLKYVFGLSFAIVSLFYLALSAVVSGAASVGATFTVRDGILSLLPEGSIRLVASLCVSVLLVANLNAWVFGGKKQMQEVLPAHVRERTPLLVYYLVTSMLLLLIDVGMAGLADLFLLSNQHWIVVYGGILAFYFKIATSTAKKLVGVVAALSFLLLLSGCSILVGLNIAVFALSYLFHRRSSMQLARGTRGIPAEASLP